MELQTVSSIFDLTPLEQGGTVNRRGIDFQDHVAAEFCLDMLLGTELMEVWCETQDDITLIWRRGGVVVAEFVQVKSNVSFNAWSVSNLCDRKGLGSGHSILEKSLANDRCKEKCCFRMVSSQTVNDDLKVLTYRIGSVARKLESDEFKVLDEALAKKVKDFLSPNGRDYKFWAENIEWEVKHDSIAVENQAIRKLRKFLEQQGFVIGEEQLEELYRRLTRRVYQAGLEDCNTNSESKRIKKADLQRWIIDITTQTLHPVMGRSNRMQGKMEAALLPDDIIEMAKEERRRYREEILNPKYLTIDEHHLVEGEVLAQLQVLKAKLDVGIIDLQGPEFHALCLEKLEEIKRDLPLKTSVPLVILHGNMYDIVNRCYHRFNKIVRRSA